ncbi:MAG: type IV pilus secretin PilQ [Acidobacteriia bacterium]|jgi:type IV pilus assembly protein PilQ|nr:type IV pilus secretin PilQ [Terriglobia bacterium]
MSRNWRVPRVGMTFVLVAVLSGALAPWSAAEGSAANGGAAAVPVVRVEAVVDSQSVRFEAESTGALEFVTRQPTERVFVVDITGQAAEASTQARVLTSGQVSSYRILQHRSDEKPVVRLEVLLRTPVQPRIERRGAHGLVVLFHAGNAATPRPAPARLAEPAVAATPATVLHNVEVVKQEGQALVRVEGNGRLTYRALRLANPWRLVLDFENTRARVGRHTIPGGVRPVGSVRVGQFTETTTRVVIELDSRARYEVRTEGHRLTVAFPQAEGEPSAAAQAVLPAPAAGLASSEIAQLALPAFLTQPTATLASLQQGVEPASNPGTPPAASATGTNARKAEKGTESTAAPRPTSAQATQYTGEPISVNLKDVDLKDFFRLIHEISGLNIVLDPNVSGSLTIVLDDVPWDQALDIVLRNNNLDKQLEGNVLRIATRETLKKEAETLRDLQRAQAEAVEPVTTTRVLSYAKASAVRDNLRRFLSARGEILSDDRSNMLIIRDIPSVLPTIDNLIAQLDQKSQQVEIEARVVAATRQFSREIGTQFGFIGPTTGGRSVFGGLSTVGTSPIQRNATTLQQGPVMPPLIDQSTSPPTVQGPNPLPLNINLGARGATSGISFSHVSPNLALDFIISAAESRGVGKLLSKPKVMTQNNEKAEVKQGTKLPIQTVINNTITVQFVDAVLKLEVTPQITAEGTIFMDVLVENTAIDPGIERILGIPALTTQATSTKITVPDGGTFVIGGVIISSQRTDVAQVPLIGSIPVIGHLFKRTTVNTQSQELLFFITPRIIPN